MMDEKMKRCFQVGTRECGLLCGALGAVIALMLMLFGFWGTLFIAVLFGAGYFFGVCDHKAALIKTAINKLFPPKGE